MKVSIVYPVPFDAWDVFEPDVRRFTDSFKQFPAGWDYELLPVANWGEPTDEARSLFYGLKTRWLSYCGNGCDSGSWQRAAASLPGDTFLVCCTSRVYFHRSGWLNHLMQARALHGPGLYGSSASREGKPHICTRFFGIDLHLFDSYPVESTRREDGRHFEVGDQGIDDLATHCRKNEGTSAVVYWTGEFFSNSMFEQDNTFRKGDQSNLLVWDRHTKIYADASPEEKARLEKIQNGG